MRNEFEINEERLQQSAQDNDWDIEDLRKLTTMFGIYKEGDPDELSVLLDVDQKVFANLLMAICQDLDNSASWFHADNDTDGVYPVLLAMGIYIGAEYMRTEAPHLKEKK